MSRNNVNYSNLNVESIKELELDGILDINKFQPLKKRKRFDDGTSATKTGRKKEKVQRGGKDDITELMDED